MTDIFHSIWRWEFSKMLLVTCPNVGCRKVFKYRVDRKRHLESKKYQGKPPEPLTSLESITKIYHGYLLLFCNTVINHSNNKKAIKIL